MTRRALLLLLLAVLVTACATARAETPDFAADLSAFVTATTSPVARSQPITGMEVGAIQVGSAIVLEGFVLPAGDPIEQPEDFPTVAELQALVANPVTHRRARISSGLGAVDGIEQLAGQGADVSRLNQRMTITLFDDLLIWDDPEGTRLVFIPGLGGLYQTGDGTWQEAMGPEWTVFGPITDWSMAQEVAAQVVEAQPQVVGYEMVADTPTVRLFLARGEDRADVWLDETGAALRIVQAFTGPDETSRWVGVWNVETLSPELTDPLPFSR